jgi:hypothetical protein
LTAAEAAEDNRPGGAKLDGLRVHAQLAISRPEEAHVMRKRAPLLAFAVVGLVCWVAVAAAEPPTTSISTDTVVPGTTQSSTFTDANGDTVTKTEVDFTWASIVNAIPVPGTR